MGEVRGQIRARAVSLFWLRKGCRVPKWQGSASSDTSTLAIHDFARMALEGKGRLFIVECSNAADGRQRIRAWLAGESVAGMATVLGQTGDRSTARVVALGTLACLALSGASANLQRWDREIAERGRVRESTCRALPRSLLRAFGSWDPQHALGQGIVHGSAEQ